MEYSLAEVNQIAKIVVEKGKNYPIWVFEGEMGAGKTTLIKAVGEILGIVGDVHSPTFSIVNEYINSEQKTIYHFDFYRIKNPEEALDFGVEEYFDSGNLCLLEWAENIKPFLPDTYFKIEIKQNDFAKRNILLTDETI